MSLDTNTNSAPIKASSALDPARQAKQKAELKKACRQFEALFTSLLWKEMRKTVPQGELFGGGFGEKLFTGLRDQAMADSVTQGSSMGLADMLERQLGPPARPGSATSLATAASGAQSYLRAFGSDYQMPVDGAVSSPFGERVHPITGELKMHQGLDLAAEQSSPVRAARSGAVSFAGQSEGYGNLVIIEHPGGQKSYYGHLKNIAVQEGQKVNQGEPVGTVGSTGISTGPHLHFEIRGADGAALDPMPLMASGTKTTT